MKVPAQVLSLPELTLDAYRIEGVEDVLTPALAIYPEIVDANIRATLGLLGGDANRWRPHVKTSKLAFVMRRLVERGVANFKCSTTLELVTACENGALDVVVAYPMVGANAKRARAIADQFPGIMVSALVESLEQLEPWKGSRIGLFIDVNPGMDRTGIEQDRVDEIVALARAIQDAGQVFRGLHYYDGHLSSLALPERDAVAHRGYDHLMEIEGAFERNHIPVEEIITAGTPAFPCSLSYAAFGDAAFIHRVSPGTVVYNDCSSLAQLPSEYGYEPAAIVISTVVSNPSQGRFTCDAGHKTVSADSGVPTCAVVSHPEYVPSKPSEEHLPIDVPRDSTPPHIGDTLYLVPKHICPTVNNFDHALLIEGGRIIGVERVTARGREAPAPGRS
ncbi:MAG TPA: D-TA family PLP-dependent enzyme [Blastocatellia bacterium]|nr:D-TA family PLP-dependent enzyme [Blastocatellia bacterium]